MVAHAWKTQHLSRVLSHPLLHGGLKASLDFMKSPLKKEKQKQKSVCECSQEVNFYKGYPPTGHYLPPMAST